MNEIGVIEQGLANLPRHNNYLGQYKFKISVSNQLQAWKQTKIDAETLLITKYLFLFKNGKTHSVQSQNSFAKETFYGQKKVTNNIHI